MMTQQVDISALWGRGSSFKKIRPRREECVGGTINGLFVKCMRLVNGEGMKIIT